MRHRLLVPEIEELLAAGRRDDLIQVLGDLHPLDAAEILGGFDPERIPQVMALLPLAMERDVFAYLDPDVQENIVLGSGRDRVKVLLATMPSDDRASFMERLEPRVRESMLPLLTKAVRDDLLRREHFEEDQVGAILSTEYLALDPEQNAREAIEEVRRQESCKETVYYCFVVDGGGALLGIVSLRKLLLAPPGRKVGDIMNRSVVSVRATADREEAARKIREYDLLALPVTDDQNRLLGIVTHDDAADILEQEAAEDLQKMAGIATPAEKPADRYFGAGVATQFRRRVPVLFVLSVGFVVTGTVIKGFNHTIEHGPDVLYAILPMILATGGNVGNQASIAVILGLRHDLRPAAFLRVLWRELRISSCLAGVLGLIAGAQAWLLSGSAPSLAVCGAVTLALALHVITASMLGASIPLAVAALGRDPSMVANPALTTLADLSGALIYFVTLTALIDIGG